MNYKLLERIVIEKEIGWLEVMQIKEKETRKWKQENWKEREAKRKKERRKERSIWRKEDKKGWKNGEAGSAIKEEIQKRGETWITKN